MPCNTLNCLHVHSQFQAKRNKSFPGSMHGYKFMLFMTILLLFRSAVVSDLNFLI